MLLQTILDLISIPTVTGNASAIDRCLDYVKNRLLSLGASVEISYDKKASPVLFASNVQAKHFDVLILGHLDVVPAEDTMFHPKFEDDKIYGRGALDMKSFAAVAMHSMGYVIEKKLPIKFGIIFSTDEEQGSLSLEAFLQKNSDLKADIVLDNDVGGDITKIITRCKNPVYVKLTATGKAAHGSTPWEGLDANERLFETWQNIRKIYPAYASDKPAPKNTWIDTVHFAKMKGGDTANIISDHATALLDFRLTEKSSVETLKKRLQSCIKEGVSFEIEMSSVPVMIDEKNGILLAYKECAEQVLGKKIDFEYIGGATDSRAFYQRGSIIIMHSGSGQGMHGKDEYVDFKSVEQVAKIQTTFLSQLVAKK